MVGVEGRHERTLKGGGTLIEGREPNQHSICGGVWLSDDVTKSLW